MNDLNDFPQIRPCPFCGIVPTGFGRELRYGKVETTVIHPYDENSYCPLGMLVFPLSYWNKRVYDTSTEDSEYFHKLHENNP